ncbi:MAG: LamB/YcsF family protein [Thermodesulfobacteriota bacterium]
MQIDVNCDLGEGFGAYSAGLDSDVMPHITSANVACGWHAGDPVVMQTTVEMASKFNVRVGAHPGYPDLMGFGRREMNCSPGELESYILYQVGALQAFCRSRNLKMQHVKPHGALYHAVLADSELAGALARAVQKADPGLIILTLSGPKGDVVSGICEQLGLRVAREAFPDRSYNRDGTLVSRNLPGAVLEEPDEVAARALSMARDGIALTPEGERVTIEAQTLCVHGDSPAAVDAVSKIRQMLDKNKISLVPLQKILS